MDRQALRGHLLVLLATLCGIAGMGILFRAIMHGSLVGVGQGMPLVMIGLWWAGRELGRSMVASRTRSRVRARRCGSEAGYPPAGVIERPDQRSGIRARVLDLVLAPRQRSTMRRDAGPGTRAE